MKKKILAVVLCVAMLAIAIVGGTLAYFTDTTAADNVFTVGDVKIELIESYVHRSGSTAYETVEGYPETPAAEDGNHSDEQIIAASGEVYDEYLAAQLLAPGVSVNKMPYVKNNGTLDAWVRIRVMIPKALNAPTLDSSVICTTALNEEFSRPEGVDFYAVDGSVTVDSVEYDVYTFIRDEALVAGEMTYWNVWNTVRMDDAVTSEQAAELIEAGAIVDGQFNIRVEVDAIQATGGLDTPAKAWAAFDAE